MPPSVARKAAIGRAFLRRGAEGCARARGLRANRLAVDFYARSGVLEVARDLNGR